MSCNLVFAASLLFSAEYSASNVPVVEAVASAPLSDEAELRSLVQEAGRLKAVVQYWMEGPAVAEEHFARSAPFMAFSSQAAELSHANMQAHLALKASGTDGDLTCILRGIAEDIPKKVALVEAAKPGPERRQAFEELAYLLNDNVEVILAPPHVEGVD